MKLFKYVFILLFCSISFGVLGETPKSSDEKKSLRYQNISKDIQITQKYLKFPVVEGGENKHVTLIIGGDVERTYTIPLADSRTSKYVYKPVTVYKGLNITVVVDALNSDSKAMDLISQADYVNNSSDVVIDTYEHTFNSSVKFLVDKKYLNIPIKNGAKTQKVTLVVDGKAMPALDIALTDGDPDWWAFRDLSEFQGKELVIYTDKLPKDSKILSRISQSDVIIDTSNSYKEALRPQLHYSARRGWGSNVSGLIYNKGEYHMFYQYNPYGLTAGNTHRGHAVSKDLIHWTELPVAHYPDSIGSILSGTGIVDEKNVSGLQKGKEKTILEYYSMLSSLNPILQGLAYSNNKGITWMNYTNNPVVLPDPTKDNARDPKVFWFKETERWIMILATGSIAKNNAGYSIFSSTDLLKWKYVNQIKLPSMDGIPFTNLQEGCPEMFEIALEGSKSEKKWVFYGGKGIYYVGRFNGNEFFPEADPLELNKGNNFIASPIISNMTSSDKRIIMIPNIQSAELGKSFKPMAGLPVELTLRQTTEGMRLFTNPVKEFNKLRIENYKINPKNIKSGVTTFTQVDSRLLDLEIQFEVTGQKGEFELDLKGTIIRYNASNNILNAAGNIMVLKPEKGKVTLRMILDEQSVELFANDGLAYIPARTSGTKDKPLSLSVIGEGVKFTKFDVYKLKSIWSH